MPQFRDISTFIEKTSLDGSEEVQVSGTQKVKLVKLLEQLGDNLETSVTALSTWVFPDLSSTFTVKTWLSSLLYACGLRTANASGTTMFRFLLGSNGDAVVFGVVFYDTVNAVRVAVLFSNYGVGSDSGSTFPFAVYEGGETSSAINASVSDDAFIQEITKSGKWTLRLKIGSTEVPTAEQIPAGTSGSPLDAPASYVGWNPTNMSVEQALVALAYAAGIRNPNEGTLSAPFRVITQTSFGSGLTICSYMPADDESLKWEFGHGVIRFYYASGNLLSGTPTDDALLNDSSWETYPIRIDYFEGAEPADAVISPSAITVKAGDNINAAATTLVVTVGGSPSFNIVNKYLRDAVISVAYNAAVTFSAQNSTVVVRKSADVDTITASSGKKVYTIHWSPLAVQNGTVSSWEAYVNVAVYV